MIKRSAWITIDYSALQYNLQQVHQFAPHAQVMAVIKANAYGHGMINVAQALPKAKGFAVSCLAEALVLREAGFKRSILVLQGCKNSQEINAASIHNLRVVIHDATQLQQLEQIALPKQLHIALKLDTGMHRLGLPIETTAHIYQKLRQHAQIHPDIWLMSHLACADEVENVYTTQQLTLFKHYTQSIKAPRSLANSAGLMAWPKTQMDWVRPGIMLYGVSPFLNTPIQPYKLKAVMSFYAPIIAVHHFQKGESLGYGLLWTCPETMPVAVVACGYADGYPRHAISGTPVWINGYETQLIGRVSMDMIMIDLRGIRAMVGDIVELWGKHIAVNRVAQSADTIAYELLCHAGNQCPQHETA